MGEACCSACGSGVEPRWGHRSVPADWSATAVPLLELRDLLPTRCVLVKWRFSAASPPASGQFHPTFVNLFAFGRGFRVALHTGKISQREDNLWRSGRGDIRSSYPTHPLEHFNRLFPVCHDARNLQRQNSWNRVPCHRPVFPVLVLEDRAPDITRGQNCPWKFTHIRSRGSVLKRTFTVRLPMHDLMSQFLPRSNPNADST